MRPSGILPHAKSEAAGELFRRHVPDVDTASSLIEMGLSSPLDLLVPSPSARRVGHGENIRSHVWGGPLPRGSFVHVGMVESQDVFVCRPEFLALMMGKELPLRLEVMLMYELCGTYMIDESTRTGLASRNRITSTMLLKRFLDSTSSMPGTKTARRAVAQVLDDSASPMETANAMFFRAPCMQGGYRAPRALLNDRLDLSPIAREISGKTFLKLDFHLPEIKMDLEYDGFGSHFDETSYSRDASRRDAILAMGINVMTITKRQLHDTRAMDGIARVIARKYHLHQQWDRDDYLPIRREFQRAVLAQASCGGALANMESSRERTLL